MMVDPSDPDGGGVMDTKKALSAIAVAAAVVTLGAGPAQANDET
jgi:hypothetical protein